MISSSGFNTSTEEILPGTQNGTYWSRMYQTLKQHWYIVFRESLLAVWSTARPHTRWPRKFLYPVSHHVITTLDPHITRLNHQSLSCDRGEVISQDSCCCHAGIFPTRMLHVLGTLIQPSVSSEANEQLTQCQCLRITRLGPPSLTMLSGQGKSHLDYRMICINPCEASTHVMAAQTSDIL